MIVVILYTISLFSDDLSELNQMYTLLQLWKLSMGQPNVSVTIKSTVV